MIATLGVCSLDVSIGASDFFWGNMDGCVIAALFVILWTSASIVDYR